MQQEFGTLRRANRRDQTWVHEQIAADDEAFIGGRDVIFLSTVDADGNPTGSYMGGPAGSGRVLDAHTLVFPGYDGNGMGYSMGNIVGQGRVGRLFIDFEHPHRVRVQGTAQLLREHPLLTTYTEAQYLVQITVAKV